MNPARSEAHDIAMDPTRVIVRRPERPGAIAVVFDAGAPSESGTALADALSAADVASITLRGRDDAPEPQELTAWAREIVGAPPAPVLFGAVGPLAPELIRQARQVPGTAVVTVNGSGARLLPSSTRVSAPAMFLVDGDVFGRRFVSRLAAAIAGRHGTFALLESHDDPVLSRWLAGVAVTPPRRATLGRRLAPVAVAGALAATPLVAVIDPFAGAIAIGSDAIRGDHQATAVAESTTGSDDLPTVAVDPGAVRGDGHVAPLATGSINLVDGSGFKWFLNTNITFVTTTGVGASAAVSEASFVGPLPATTLNGGVANATLSDGFDGYNSLFVDSDATFGALNGIPAAPSGDIYNMLGAAPVADPTCSNREYVFPVFTTPEGLTVQRSVYVPDDDGFARWINRITNPTAAPVTVDAGTSNDLGSDTNTRIDSTSSGDASATVDDLWVTTYENYSGTTSTDPRLAHVLGGAGAPVAAAAVQFANGDDSPLWRYRPTVAVGETITIVNFASVHATRAASRASAASLATLPPNALRCMSSSELHSIVNFALPTVSIDAATVDENVGTASLTVRRTGDLDGSATATVGVSAGSATAADYGSPTVATFAAGAATASVSLPIVDDSLYEGAETFTATVTSTDGFLRPIAAPAPSATVTINPSDPAAEIITVAPTRVFDSRDASPLGPRSTISVQLTGVAGVPADARAVILNLTSTSATAASFLTVYPSGEERPLASSLNTEPGVDVPNLVVTKVGADGRALIYNNAGTGEVVVDVVGYVPSGARYTPITPVRALDTRNGTGAPTAIVGPAGQIDLDVTGIGGPGGVPSSDVGAVLVNVTSTESTVASFVTVWPTGATRPTASSLNTEPGVDVATLVLAKVSATGRISLFNNAGSGHLVADVVGYFPTYSSLTSLNPIRVLDSRNGTGTPSGPFGERESRSVLVSGTGAPLPAGVGTVVMSVTSTDSTAPSFVTVWASGAVRPATSNLNTEPGQDIPNLVVVPVGADGRIQLFNNSGSTHLIADIVAWTPGAS